MEPLVKNFLLLAIGLALSSYMLLTNDFIWEHSFSGAKLDQYQSIDEDFEGNFIAVGTPNPKDSEKVIYWSVNVTLWVT